MRNNKLVTRTMETTKVYYMTVDTITEEVNNLVTEISGNCDKETALKVLKRDMETENYKVVAVLDVKVKETLYGMSEEDFRKYAIELDATTRKPLNE